MSMSFFKSKTQSNQVLACKNQIFSDINPPQKKCIRKISQLPRLHSVDRSNASALLKLN